MRGRRFLFGSLFGSVLLALSVVTAAAATATGADTITIMDNGKTVTHACTGTTVVKVMGNQNKVTLTGECARVEVLGNENQVIAEAAGEISVMGNANTVAWERGVGGKDPAVSNLGTRNKVSKVAK